MSFIPMVAGEWSPSARPEAPAPEPPTRIGLRAPAGRATRVGYGSWGLDALCAFRRRDEQGKARYDDSSNATSGNMSRGHINERSKLRPWPFRQ
jgi:hypothetical protein